MGIFLLLLLLILCLCVSVHTFKELFFPRSRSNSYSNSQRISLLKFSVSMWGWGWNSGVVEWWCVSQFLFWVFSLYIEIFFKSRSSSLKENNKANIGIIGEGFRQVVSRIVTHPPSTPPKVRAHYRTPPSKPVIESNQRWIR